MIRTRWLTKGLVVVAVGGLVVAACSSSTGDTTVSTALSSQGSDTTVSTALSGQGSDTTVTATATLILPGESIVAGFLVVDLVEPSSSGAGEYPLFGWEPVTGAASYQLVVSGPSGPTWAWEGSETEIRLGALEGEPPSGYGGPRLAGPSCWSVVALDADGHVVAASEVVPVSPGDGPAQSCALTG
jgi:hypothetical protein